MKYVFFLCFFISGILTFSQNAGNNETVKKHAVGITLGSFSGYGLTYKYFPGKFGFQVNNFLYASQDNTNIALGGSFLYSLSRFEKFNIYYHLSSAFFYREFMSYDWLTGDEVKRFNRDFNPGTGVGIEVHWERISCSVYYGIGFYNELRTFSMLGGGGSLFFKF